MKKNKAEVELLASQLMYPSIHYSRIAALDSILTSSGHYWFKGQLIPLHFNSNSQKEYTSIVKSIRNKTAITVDEALHNHCMKSAIKHLSESESEGFSSVEELALRYKNTTLEQHGMPFKFRLHDYCKVSISQIPDDVDKDFLALCVEYLNCALNSKTDFNEKTILTPCDQKLHFGKSGNGLDEKELETRKALSFEIGKILAEVDGKSWPPSEEEAKKQLKEWNNFHSPAARAKRANQDNENSKKIAMDILSDLKKRNLIPENK